MSNNQQIIDLMGQLRELGCRVSADGDKLRIRKTKNTIPTELIQQVKINKTEILSFLKETQNHVVTSSGNIPKLPPNAVKQLSFAQQRLWFLGQMEGSNATYNMPISLQLEGELNIDALHKSLSYILNRHESLRMYFPTIEGQPQIRIKKIEDFEILTQQDLRNLDQDTQSITVQKLIDDYVQESFNLNTGPLFKTKLLQLKDEQFILLINMHHITSDGWSMGIFMRELRHAYLAFSQGQKPTLEPLSIQYSDFANWQRNWLQGEVLQTQINYWKQQLKNAPPRLELPTDHSRPPIQSYKGSHYSHSLNPKLTAQLNTLAQQQGVSLYMLLLTIFNLLLSRYSRQNDLCIGSPIANRSHPQTEELIGFFANTLVLRSYIKSEQTFLEFLQQTRQICLDAYQHQDIPFELIVEQLKPVRSLSYNPIFQVMFAVENNENGELNLPKLKIEWVEATYPFSKFDLSLLAIESDGQLNCTWEYATDLFELSTIKQMAERWQVLLQEIISNPQQKIATIPWLTKTDKQQLKIWNQTNKNYPQDKTLVELFEKQVKQNPNNIAVIFEEQSLTYEEVNQKANQLAHYLQQNYVIEPDTLIGICVERSLAMIIGLLGVLKAGAAYVPIDPNYPDARIKILLEDSGILLLLTQKFLKDKSNFSQLEKFEQVISLDEFDFESYSSNNLNLKIQSNNLAYIIYTSGSTGKPKGVMIEHQSLVNLSLNWGKLFDIHSQSCLLQFGSFSFDLSIGEIATNLIHGACLYLANKDTLLPTQTLVEFLESNKITHSFLSPSVLSVLPKATLSYLRNITVGGEACSAEVVEKWANKRHLFNCYGPTETTVTATVSLCQVNGKNPPIGKPIDNIRVYILDDNHQLLPPGIPGELCIAGVGLARGYLNRPDLTNEKFIEVNLLGKTERIYKTGDLAKWKNDGNLEFLGRIDHQIKLRGFRIELGEIEAILLKNPAVKEAVVNLLITEKNQQLLGYVTGEAIPNLSEQLKRHIKAYLPEYMIPSQIIRLEQFPLTPNGKVDRQALSNLKVESQRIYQAPRNHIEQQLMEIWSSILDSKNISIHDNFFDLGGHSILGIKLLNQIQNNFNQKLPLTSLFQNPTIAQLAQQLSQIGENLTTSDLLILQTSGEKTPLFCVAGANGHAFYFRDLAINFADKRPVYGLETPGRDGSHPLPNSVEDHANSLIATLQQQQEKGPYILIGYSSGCAVALEMAFQLEQQGETISFLGIFDTGLVNNPNHITQRSDLDWIWNMTERIEAIKGISLGLNYQQLANQPDDQNRWNFVAEVLYRHNVLPEHSTLDLLKTNLTVMKQATLNYALYQPNFQISAPIVLFRAQEAKEIVVQEYQAMSYYDQPDWGWQAYSQKPVKVIWVPGNHGRMLYEPNAKILADYLKQSIQENFSQKDGLVPLE
ncbi:MAG: amino acid adenylation domain-containing protein [Crocosphaera sp.]|nr:amino acid adenylation domain-containing protein [Crocosphaera sp.]